MLSIPVFAEIGGVTVFRDDADPTHFYYLPRNPRILRGEDGKPMFTFLRYQFPIEREGKEPGGGYLVFTTAMTEEPQVLERTVKPALQQRLRSENPTNPVVPQVVLAPVDFTEGEVRLIMMQNNQFVKAVNLGRPSLFGNNTASVAVELSADGATLFYEALRQGGSVAAIEYNLRFPVRLPAITILGHVDAKQVKSAVMTYTETQVTDGSVWGDDTHTERHRSSLAETMESQGLIHLEILKGSVGLSEEEMDSLRAFAFRAMDAFIKDHFLTGGTIESDDDRKSQWMTFLAQDITATFDLNVTYRDVIPREYNPSAQINPSFLGAPVQDLVLEIDLNNAPWYFNNLEVTVDTNLDFARYGDIVHSVIGHLSYDQPRPDGTRLIKRESVVFTKDDTKPKTFKTRIAAVGKDTYHVELEVNYKSGPTLQTVLKRFDTTTRHLTLDVPNPGVMEVSFTTAPKAFDDTLTQIEAEVEYGDPRGHVPRAVETVVLNAAKPEQTYKRTIYAPWEQPYRYRFTYAFTEDGTAQRSTTDWIEASPATQYVNVPTPFDEAFRLTIIPSVDWSEVNELVVDLDYDDDGSDYRVTKSFSFSEAAATMQAWKFPLRDPNHRAYRYAQNLLLKNGAVQASGWKDRDSDAQTLLVGNAPGGVVTVEVDPGDVDLGGAVRRAIVTLRYSDPVNVVEDTETLLFRDATPQTWKIARADARQSSYAYDVEYVMKDGSRRTLKDQRGTVGAIRDFLFLPAAPA